MDGMELRDRFPDLVIVTVSSRAARSTTSPPLFRKSRMLTVAMMDDCIAGETAEQPVSRRA